MSDAAYGSLASRYGAAATDVLEVAAARPDLAAPIVGGLPDLLAEAAVAARREQARGVGDVMLRRTRVGCCGPALTVEPVDGPVWRVARALGDELGWDARRRDEEVDRFSAEAHAEGLPVGAAAPA